MGNISINDMIALVNQYEIQLNSAAEAMVGKLLNGCMAYIAANPLSFAEKRVACIELVKTDEGLNDYEVEISSSYNADICREYKYISDEIISGGNSFVIKTLVESFKENISPDNTFNIYLKSTNQKDNHLLIVIDLHD